MSERAFRVGRGLTLALAAWLVGCSGAQDPGFGSEAAAEAPAADYVVNSNAGFTGSLGMQGVLCHPGDQAVRGACEAVGGVVTRAEPFYSGNQMGWRCWAAPADTKKGEEIFASVWCAR